MKKFTVAVLIIGAFLIYSFLYNAHADPVAITPNTTNDSSLSSSSSPSPTSAATAASTATTSGQLYKDGTYTGSVADAHWGSIQVKAIIQHGKITDVQFLQYPNERTKSIEINSYADPQLTSEAIAAQSANVDVVTGATDSSQAFTQSLSDALAQAKA